MSRLDRFDAGAYRDWLGEADFHGVVHVVGDDDEPPLTITRGQSDRVAGLPIQPGTRFACASTTKMLTGLTVARLVDRGDLRYEDCYAELVPVELRPRDLDARVTLEHLLSHTSGVGDYADEYDGPPFEQIWETMTPARIRGPRDTFELMRDLPRTGEPGAAARYNNGGYILVGLAIEEATGLSFPDAVRREVFEPLGMTASGFWPLDGLEPDLAVGYLPPDETHPAWRTNVYSTPAMGGPDGGAQVTAADLVRALDGLTGCGTGATFLTDATRARVTTAVATSPEEGVGYGLGAIRVGGGPSARIGHSGEDPGASSRCWTYDTGERVVVLSNVTERSWEPFRRLDELLAAIPPA
jgi:D-alanyl-D-alanine carboxypeptidase